MDPVSTGAAGLNALKIAWDLLERAAAKLRKKSEDPEITASLTQANEQMQVAKAELANDLGYELCRHHFPPGIFIEVGESLTWKRCDTCALEMEYPDHVEPYDPTE